jgi:hypothetical protein
LESLFQKIVSDPVEIPSWFSEDLSEICIHLLKKCPKTRLGCLKNKSLDVKNHNWFSNVDWQGILKQTIKAPFVPIPSAISVGAYESSLDADCSSGRNTETIEDYEKYFESF